MHFAFIRSVEPHKLITFLLFLEFLNNNGTSVKEQIKNVIFTTVFLGEKIQKLFIFTILYLFLGGGGRKYKRLYFHSRTGEKKISFYFHDRLLG